MNSRSAPGKRKKLSKRSRRKTAALLGDLTGVDDEDLEDEALEAEAREQRLEERARTVDKLLSREDAGLSDADRAQLRSRHAKGGLKCRYCGRVGVRATLCDSCAGRSRPRASAALEPSPEKLADRHGFRRPGWFWGEDGAAEAETARLDTGSTALSVSASGPLDRTLVSAASSHRATSSRRRRRPGDPAGPELAAYDVAADPLQPAQRSVRDVVAYYRSAEHRGLWGNQLDPRLLVSLQDTPGAGAPVESAAARGHELRASAVETARRAGIEALGPQWGTHHQGEPMPRGPKASEAVELLVDSAEWQGATAHGAVPFVPRDSAEANFHAVVQRAIELVKVRLQSSVPKAAETIMRPPKKKLGAKYYTQAVWEEHREYFKKQAHVEERGRGRQAHAHKGAVRKADEVAYCFDRSAATGGRRDAEELKMYQPDAEAGNTSLHSEGTWLSVLATHDKHATSGRSAASFNQKLGDAFKTQSGWVARQARELQHERQRHEHLLSLLQTELHNDQKREIELLRGGDVADVAEAGDGAHGDGAGGKDPKAKDKSKDAKGKAAAAGGTEGGKASRADAEEKVRRNHAELAKARAEAADKIMRCLQEYGVLAAVESGDYLLHTLELIRQAGLSGEDADAHADAYDKRAEDKSTRAAEKAAEIPAAAEYGVRLGPQRKRAAAAAKRAHARGASKAARAAAARRAAAPAAALTSLRAGVGAGAFREAAEGDYAGLRRGTYDDAPSLPALISYPSALSLSGGGAANAGRKGKGGKTAVGPHARAMRRAALLLAKTDKTPVLEKSHSANRYLEATRAAQTDAVTGLTKRQQLPLYHRLTAEASTPGHRMYAGTLNVPMSRLM